MMKYNVTGVSSEVLAKRVLKLAWDASGVFGMGVFQDRGPLISEDKVWEATRDRRDYSFGSPGSSIRGPGVAGGTVSADYVFGRMMKFNFEYGDGFIQSHSGNDKSPWRHDYQSFVRRYKDFDAIVKSAVESLVKDGNEQATAEKVVE